VRSLFSRFVGLILGVGDLPLSDQLKFQQTFGSVLQDHFRPCLRPPSAFLSR
jgi:hypothetical protein